MVCRVGKRRLVTLSQGVRVDPIARFDWLAGDWPGGDLTPRRNVWQYTEDVASSRYTTQNATKQTDTKIANANGTPVTLTRVTCANFYSSLRSQAKSLGLAPFVSGTRYLVSCFSYMSNAAEGFFWPRGGLTLSTDAGHGARYLTNRVRRVWTVTQATSTSELDAGITATTALGSGTTWDPVWFDKGNGNLPSSSEVYLGGFQIEAVSSSYKDGIALIGDSTMQGSSGGVDLQSSIEVSRWLEALLNVTVFNRAASGERTDQMDARWSADITPLAGRCKYAVIQGGVNDFGQSRALADVQTSVTSMHNKAIADGLTPVHFTCTSSSGIIDVPADEANRKTFNEWLLLSGWNVIDIAAVVDPGNTGVLTVDPGDGTHYGATAKKLIGIAAASSSIWSFTRPTPYQKVTAATYP